MPGPRKNLTPLDMKMMGLAFNQGGIINFLGQQPEVTAPVRAQSHADSPPVQLAYITDAEKDLLVKSNIHGSMDGKPNPGPAGLPSLDDFFNIPGGGVGGGNVGTGQSYQSQSDYGIGAGQAVGGGQGGTGGQVFVPTGGPPGQQQGFVQDDLATESAAQIAQNLQEKIAVEAAKKQAEALAQTGVEQAQEVRDTLLGRIKTKIMGGGEGGNLDLTKEEAYANLPAGMHPLRKQYEYLKEKYGPNWANTTQAKVLEGYLSGVPVERGGGLGARSDETDEELIGATNWEDIPEYDPITNEFRTEAERKALAEAAQYRLNALNQFPMGSGGIGSLTAAEAGASGFDLSKLDPKKLRLGLSPDQYFRFRQQLMAADPTSGNQLYKDTFPGSSGAGLGVFAEKFLPGANIFGALTGGIFPERDLSGYQQNIDPISVGFEPLPVPDQSNSNEPVRRPGFKKPQNPNYVDPSPEVPDPRYPLPGDPFRPPFMPGTGIETAFNPMFLGPSFRGSQYTNQGVSPAFYENLRRYYG